MKLCCVLIWNIFVWAGASYLIYFKGASLWLFLLAALTSGPVRK